MVSMATFSRIKAPIACAIILGAILGWSMANFPDYGRYFYNQTAPADYDKYTDQTGFPAGEGYKELSNRADIVEAEENYVVTVDVKDLKSANMYKSILKSDYYYGKFSKYNNANTEGGVGTFYVAKLKSGDEVIVLIDDRTFTIPKSGTVKLQYKRDGKHRIYRKITRIDRTCRGGSGLLCRHNRSVEKK